MVVHPSVPADTVSELIAYAKSNQDKLTKRRAASARRAHLAGELFKMMAGIRMVLVPYRGGAPAVTDLLVGQVQVYFGPISATIEHIRAGKLRALAVTTVRDRTNCRTSRPWLSTCRATKRAHSKASVRLENTSPEIIDKLNREINAAFTDPKFKARLASKAA